jgi:hypothetical protein
MIGEKLPLPGEQFDQEGLSNMHDDKGEDRISKGPHDERVKSGIVGGRRDIRGKLRKGVDYGEKDYVDLESVSNLDDAHSGEEIDEEERMVNRIAARQEEQEEEERKRILDSGKAIVVHGPGEQEKHELEGAQVPRQFQTVAEQQEYLAKREIAKEKARQRYEEANKKIEDKKSTKDVKPFEEKKAA